MTTDQMTKLAIAGGIIFAAIKFAPNALVKAGAAGVAAMIVARQIPYVKDVV